jgi:hypothetical protein
MRSGKALGVNLYGFAGFEIAQTAFQQRWLIASTARESRVWATLVFTVEFKDGTRHFVTFAGVLQGFLVSKTAANDLASSRLR